MRGIDKVLESLDDYTDRGDEYRTKCPSHQGESDDSLSIKEDDDGTVLLHCHTGCENEEIIECLGLEMRDLFSGNHTPQSKPIGPKESMNGKVFTVETLPGNQDEYMPFQKSDGTIYYIQRHKGPVYRVVDFDEDGDPLFMLGLADYPRILFGLPSLAEAIGKGEPAIHTEGCKDATTAQDRLEMAGVTSGGSTSWKGEFAQEYEGLSELWILPDNDDEGRDYAAQVALDLVGIVPVVKIVELPGLEDKGDLTDWLDAGHTKEELLELVATTEPFDSSQA